MNDQIRILLVDDEETFVLNLARILTNRGFSVTTAGNGIEALECVAARAAFDVVVLDIKMPGLDGIETLRRIKALAPELQVIMLTGHASLDSGIQAIREGAFDYLLKPCDTEELTDKIRTASELERIRRRPVARSLVTGRT